MPNTLPPKYIDPRTEEEKQDFLDEMASDYMNDIDSDEEGD